MAGINYKKTEIRAAQPTEQTTTLPADPNNELKVPSNVEAVPSLPSDLPESSTIVDAGATSILSSFVEAIKVAVENGDIEAIKKACQNFSEVSYRVLGADAFSDVVWKDVSEVSMQIASDVATAVATESLATAVDTAVQAVVPNVKQAIQPQQQSPNPLPPPELTMPASKKYIKVIDHPVISDEVYLSPEGMAKWKSTALDALKKTFGNDVALDFVWAVQADKQGVETNLEDHKKVTDLLTETSKLFAKKLTTTDVRTKKKVKVDEKKATKKSKKDEEDEKDQKKKKGKKGGYRKPVTKEMPNNLKGKPAWKPGKKGVPPSPEVKGVPNAKGKTTSKVPPALELAKTTSDNQDTQLKLGNDKNKTKTRRGNMTMQRKTVAQRPLRTRSTVNPTVAKLQAQVNRLETKVATDEKVDMQLFLEENLEKMVAEKRITEKQSKLIVSHFEKDEDVTPLIEMAEEYEPLMQARKGADYQIATPQPVNPSYLTVIGDPDKSIKNLEAAKGKKNQLLAHYAATMGGQPAPDFDLEGYRLGLIGIQKAVMQATPRGGATS